MSQRFDDVARRMAEPELSRRSLLRLTLAALAVAAMDLRWPTALAAKAAPETATDLLSKWKSAPAQKAVGPTSARFGPCSMTVNGTSYEHKVQSSARAGSIDAVLESTRGFEKKTGTTVTRTLLINGKKEFEYAHQQLGAAATVTLTIGTAFGYKGAHLTSKDGGQTLTGTIDGRAVEPFKIGKGQKPIFVDGKPFTATLSKDMKQALSAVSAKAAQDFASCKEHAEEGPRPPSPNTRTVRRPEGSKKFDGYSYGYDATRISSINLNALFTPGCVQCAAGCDVSLWDTLKDLAECVWGIFTFQFGDCSDFVQLSTAQVMCLRRCNAKSVCHGQMCFGASGGSSVDPIASCSRGEVCIGHTGYCCPDGYPNVCPGQFNKDLPNYESGIPGGDFNNLCCKKDTTCIIVPDSILSYCCPKNLACGPVSVNRGGHGYDVVDVPIYPTCCKPGQVCAKNADPLAKGAPICCDPKQTRDEKCCQGTWCGDTCCDKRVPCNGGKCGKTCLSGVRTSDGKCCDSGVACGKKCCPAGCADAATSTCKKAKACKGNEVLCTSRMAGSNATKEVCCPGGAACFNGKCCPSGKTACASTKTGKWGCWPPVQCQSQPK